MEEKQLYSEPLPYEIYDVVYYMEKVSEVGGHPGFKLTKCYVCGYYNFGDGWRLRLHSNRNKYKYAEYNVKFTEQTDIYDAIKILKDVLNTLEKVQLNRE